MNPIRRELLNGLFVLVLASLMSAVFAAFQISFNLQLWVFIMVGASVAIGGYVVFEFVLSAEKRETEWLQRVGTPARFELNQEGTPSGADLIREMVKTISPGSDYTVIYYFDARAGMSKEWDASRNKTLSASLEQLKRGIIREYKRIITFDGDLLANDPELRSGILRVGEGPGTIDRGMGDHCRMMMSTQGCSLFVAPALVRATVILFGSDKVAMNVLSDTQDAGSLGRLTTTLGTLLFFDPPNREIVERFRQIERATERRMVAVHKIRFPEDAESTAELATR